MYRYNKKGEIIEKNFYDANGYWDGRFTYKYDDRGNNVEYNYYKNDGKLLFSALGHPENFISIALFGPLINRTYSQISFYAF